ncbi:MAG: HAMP domain-containing protein, partial [Acidobacteriota bacterium]
MTELDPLESLPHLGPDLLALVPIRGRRPRQYKVAWVLAAIFLLLGTLPVITLSSKLIERNREALKTQQQVNQLGLASSLANHLDSYVEGQRQILDVVSEALSERADIADRRSLRVDLARRRTLSRFITDGILMLRYTHRDGDWVTAVHEGFEVKDNVEALLADSFAREMNTGRSGAVDIGEPFYSEEAGGPAVLMSVPVLRDGRRVGVLSALSNMSSVWREAERSSGGYTLFALTPAGDLFTAPSAPGILGTADHRDLDIVNEFIASGGNRVMPFTAPDASGRQSTLLGAYFTTRHGWGVFVQADENLAYSFVEIMKSDTRFYTVVTARGAVVLGFLFAGWIGRPIRWLADSSVAFAEGDFTARVLVRSRNEIGELADTFNAMAETLQQYISRLKKAAVENSELFLGSIKALAAA